MEGTAYQGPVLQRVDIDRNLFAIDINRKYVHKRLETANLRLIGGLTIDSDHSQLFVRRGPEHTKIIENIKIENKFQQIFCYMAIVATAQYHLKKEEKSPLFHKYISHLLFSLYVK